MSIVVSKIATVVGSILASLRVLFTSELFRKVSAKWRAVLIVGTILLSGGMAALGVGAISPDMLVGFFQGLDAADIIEKE